MKALFNLNTYFKLLLLIISTSVLFFLLYISLYAYTNQQEKHVYKSTFAQYNNEVNSLLELNSKTYSATIVDVTFWDDLVLFTKTKNKTWYKNYVAAEFESYEVDYIGIYDLNQQLITKTSTNKINAINFVPGKAMVQLNKSKFIRYYTKIPEGVIEVFGATIHPSNDPKKNKSKPSGYFFMARLLDISYFKNIEKISASNVSLVNVNYFEEVEDDLVVVKVNLKDWNNKLVANLLFKRPFNLNFKHTKEILTIIIIASIINILIYLYYSKRWVYKPLKLIKSILETGNDDSIFKLKNTPGEFGYIGNLFEENGYQRKQLEVSKQKAEESDQLKSSFLANLSHEIRTPMNAIIGFSDLLITDNLTENTKLEYLQIIRNSGANLVSIIEDLIEMSKIDAKQITPKYKGIDIDKCLNELFETIKVTIPNEKKIDFYILDNTNAIKKNILTDEIKLKQILINLITNAIKFTDTGFVAFGYNCNEKEKNIEFVVKDSGLGIDKKNLKVIFDRFRRIDDDFSVELSGLGLGLSITKAYVEMLGGTITVLSTFGSGSVFSFTIPLEYDNSETIVDLKKSRNISANVGNQTILIAEDDNINFLLLKKILELKKYIVLRAVNGKEAVDMCHDNPDIDLVFMDIKMPILNGFEAFEIIKKIKPTLPVIAQTAYSSIEDKEKIIHAGFNDYITKPLDKEKIFELLAMIFQNDL